MFTSLFFFCFFCFFCIVIFVIVSLFFIKNIFTTQAGDNKRQKKPLYRREKVATFFTMILNGKIEILSGRDQVRVEYGAFQHLGEGCLKVPEGTWKPDFSAFVIGEDARVVRIPCSEFFVAVKGSMELEQKQ